MNKISTLVFGVLISSVCYGQISFSWAPTQVFNETLDPNATVLLKIQQVNNTNDTLYLGIEITQNDIPATWDGMVCVEGSCLGYIPPVGYTASQAPISGTTNGYTRLTINPMGETGYGELRIRVYDLNNPTDGDTAVWILNSTLNGIESYVTRDDAVTVFPNPAVEEVTFQSTSNPLKAIEFYSIDGQLVHTESIVGKQQMAKVNIANFAAGVYVAKTYDSKGLIRTHKLTVK
jgi:hypothetical protein